MAKQLITTDEAAERLGISVRRVRQLCADGTLDAKRFGRRAYAIVEASLKKAERRPRQWRQ